MKLKLASRFAGGAKVLGGWCGGGASRAAAFVRARPRGAMITAASLGALLVACLSLWGMERYLAERPEYRLALGPVSWEPLPEWVSTPAVDSLNHALSDGGRDASVSVFDRGIVGRVAGRLAEHPLVARVKEVRKTPSRGLSISVAWREPRLFVGHALLDRQGREIPRECYLPGKVPAPVLSGYRWRGIADLEGDRVLSAVYELLALYEAEGIAREFPKARLTTLDVAGLSGGGRPGREIVARTAGGISIHFTANVGPGRLLLTEQVANLREVLRRDPALSAVREYVDVRFEEPVYR